MQNHFQSLIDDSKEFFELNNIDYVQSNGLVKAINRLPDEFCQLISKEIEKDRLAQRGFKNLEISDEYSKIHMFYHCNYSKYDGVADISSTGILGPREYISCSKRGKCIAEGHICNFPGGLTKRQIEISKMIARGFSDAQICSDLFIEQNTLRAHKNNIERKIGMTGKVSIGVWATRKKII